MNKKYWYTLSFLLFLALILAVFLIYRQAIETTPTPINPVKNIPSKAEIQLIQAELDKNEAAFNKAQANNDLELCKTITNPNVESTCLAQINLKVALASQELSDCEKITDGMFMRSCIEQLAKDRKATDCQKLMDTSLRETCLSVAYYEQAKAENKADTCNLIPELVRRANCLSEIKKIDLHSDADADGFDFLQEILNGTDPNNNDTDGDGYLDGDEARNGFNPDGQGSFNTYIPNNQDYCQGLPDANLKSICLKLFEGNPLDLFDCNKVLIKDLRDYCMKNPLIK